MDIDWRLRRFDELTPAELHDALKARQDVFVVEQDCVYPDIDGGDIDCYHLLGYRDGALVAYLRIVPPNTAIYSCAPKAEPVPSIGRVLTTRAVRREGVGKQLMREGIQHTERLFPGQAIKLGAQRYLDRFYRDLGFEDLGQPYDEDGIPHQVMMRPP